MGPRIPHVVPTFGLIPGTLEVTIGAYVRAQQEPLEGRGVSGGSSGAGDVLRRGPGGCGPAGIAPFATVGCVLPGPGPVLGPHLPPNRKGTRWMDLLKVQVCYRLVDPGSEWRLHRRWYEGRAMGDLLGLDQVLPRDPLYRVLDRLCAHRGSLFGARFDVLLYDLASTYFESDRRSRTSGSSATARTVVRTACRW